MEGIVIIAVVSASGLIGGVAAMHLRYRDGVAPKSVLTAIPDEWYESQAAWLVTLPRLEAERHLAEMGPGVAATVRSYMQCPVCNEAA